ncbi:hypothetical protein HMPREF1986_01038 [Oribacterium sp. oral taxon 078 str. F0263]|nr:hypothetical protein HMPREF1986_01038 [Oribacterium sp. oral taxon 078 str. F0263]
MIPDIAKNNDKPRIPSLQLCGRCRIPCASPIFRKLHFDAIPNGDVSILWHFCWIFNLYFNIN